MQSESHGVSASTDGSINDLSGAVRIKAFLCPSDPQQGQATQFGWTSYHANYGTWVYVKTGDHAYTRKRVQVERKVGGLAVLASGPKPGEKVVTDGAMELFGAEFGGGK